MTLEDIARRLRTKEDIEEIKRLKAHYCSLKMRYRRVGFEARLKEGMRFVTSLFGLPRGFPSRCIW